jgi:hypothetical protein
VSVPPEGVGGVVRADVDGEGVEGEGADGEGADGEGVDAEGAEGEGVDGAGAWPVGRESGNRMPPVFGQRMIPSRTVYRIIISGAL